MGRKRTSTTIVERATLRLMDAVILDQVELPDGMGSVKLYDWMADEVQDGRNLVRYDQGGCEVWRAGPALYGTADRTDCFTAIAWDGTTLSGHTWSGYKMLIDLQDGAVTTLTFTK
jgi:hypothetical protein